MRKTLVVLVAAMTVAMTIPAFAELQNVEVGGSIRIRGNWYSHSDLSFDHNTSNDLLAVEQRTRVSVGADFTKDVHAFIEMDSYNIFGDNFRGLDESFGQYLDRGLGGSGDGSGLSGVDNGSGTDMHLYQAYIEMREAWGYPVTIKIGRSEFQQGDEFLIGNNDTSSQFRGLSFDGVWISYKNDKFNVGGFWTRPYTDLTFTDGSADVNFSGIHGDYTGIENMTIGGYYYYYQGSANLFNGLGNGNGTGDSQAFSTVGIRFAGNRSQFDWALNGAYQFGDSGFNGVNQNAFAAQGNVGYTFDVKTQPKIFINGAYYEGAGTQDAGKGGLIITSAPFNRLFSDHEYSEFIDNTDLSNFWNVGGGVSAQVTESINLKATGNYFSTVEDYGTGDHNLGIEAELIARYNYSEDLYFEAGYAHFFAGKAMEQGALVIDSGLSVIGSFGKKQGMDYVYIETGIKF